MSEREFLSIKEFAQLIGVHPNTVRNAIFSGRIYAFRVGSGGKSPFRIPRTEVQKMAFYDFEIILEKLIDKKLQSKKNSDLGDSC